MGADQTRQLEFVLETKKRPRAKVTDPGGILDACRRVFARSPKLRGMAAQNGLETDDVVQEAVLRSLKARRGVAYAEPGEERARFAWVAVTSTLTDLWRRAGGGKRVEVQVPTDLPAPSDDGPLGHIIREEVIREVIHEHGPGSVIAQALAGSSYSEIARHAGVHRSTTARTSARSMASLIAKFGG